MVLLIRRLKTVSFNQVAAFDELHNSNASRMPPGFQKHENITFRFTRTFYA